ncbi:hypothetical protein [Pseudaminobacter salicylatoxidans]|nr:hypothetical protein [Pseudaminobacter salicylatoxidans]
MHLDAFPVEPEPDILDRSAAAVSHLLSDARAAIVRLDAEIADKQDQRRRAKIIVEAFAPVLPKLDDGYDAADDARKSYEVAVEAKRVRGDKHWPKRGSDKAENQAGAA